MATIHGRDVLQEIELAATAEGRSPRSASRLTAAMGAYLQLVSPGIPLLGAWLYGGLLRRRGLRLRVRRRLHEHDADGRLPRRRPARGDVRDRAGGGRARAQAGHGSRSSSGGRTSSPSFPPDRVRARRSTPATSTRRSTGRSSCSTTRTSAASRPSGASAATAKQIGIGFSTYIEMCGLAPSRILGAIRYGAGGWDAATIRCLPTGTVQVLIGTSPHGQGHVTTFSQIVADRLGVADRERRGAARRHDGRSRSGWTRTAAAASPSAGRALPRHREGDREGEEDRRPPARGRRGRPRLRGRPLHGQGHRPVDDRHGRGPVRLDGPQPARTGSSRASRTTYVYDPPNFSWPAGCHIAVVEIDTETGAVDLLRYIAVDDVGTVINPMIVDGQVHGGSRRASRRPLYEEAIYDEEGNLSTGSMLNYLVPSAVELLELRGRADREPEPDEPDGREGRRRDRHDRLDGGGHERGRRRALALRRHRRRDARHARASLARDPGRRCE